MLANADGVLLWDYVILLEKKQTPKVFWFAGLLVLHKYKWVIEFLSHLEVCYKYLYNGKKYSVVILEISLLMLEGSIYFIACNGEK